MQSRGMIASTAPAPIADTICFSRKEAEQIRLKVLNCRNTKQNLERLCNLELKKMQVVFGSDLKICRVRLTASQKTSDILSKQKSRLILVVVVASVSSVLVGGAIGYSIAYFTAEK